MNPLYSRQVFTWFTTPDQLRDIANELEQLFQVARPGERAPITKIHGEETELHIVIDQLGMKVKP